MEIIESSFTGALRMIAMIIGALVIIRFVGQLMQAKRNLSEEQDLIRRKKEHEAEANRKRKNFGRTNIIGKNPPNHDVVEDAEFEEVD